MVWGHLFSETKASLQFRKVILTDNLDPMMKHFYSDGNGLFQDDNAPIQREQGLIEWFEYENDIKHKLCNSAGTCLMNVLKNFLNEFSQFSILEEICIIRSHFSVHTEIKS